MVRRVQRAPREAHPTKVLLLDTTLRLLGSTPVEAVTIDMVLTESGTSRGSLYHHYEDFPDLLEQALIAQFGQHVDESIEAFTLACDTSTSAAQLGEHLRAVTKVTQARQRADRRMQRVVIFANSNGSERMRARLCEQQQRLTSALADVIARSQDRGWLNRSLDATAVATFIQAYTVGRVVDDINPTPVDVDAWITLIDMVLDRVLLTD